MQREYEPPRLLYVTGQGQRRERERGSESFPLEVEIERTRREERYKKRQLDEKEPPVYCQC